MRSAATAISNLSSAVERRAPQFVILLLAIQTGLLGWSAACHSPTVDEVGHLPAGINIWQNGRFDLYHVNPPLVKALAAAPVMLAEPKTDWSHWNQGAGARSEWHVGRDFFDANGERTFQYFTWARWACLPLMWIGGWTCYRWGSAWYGELGGLLAAALWCFDPNLLAHGAMITPDAGAAAIGVWGGFRFWTWLSQPNWTRACLAGLGLGLSVLTKSSWILLFGIWPLLFVWWRLVNRAIETRSHAAGTLLQLALLLLIGLDVLNMGYQFDGTGRRLGDYQFVSRSLAGSETFELDRSRTGNRFRDNWLGRCPVPAPAPFLLGIDLQKHDFEAGKLCYLRGEFKEGGWWYFYLYALAVKTPVGTLLIAAIALTSSLASAGTAWRREVVLLAPAVTLFAVVSAETGFTIFLRYTLPAMPFVLIWLGRVARWAQSGPTGAGWLVTGALIWSVNSSLACYPHSLSYFNELAGGPLGGPAHLLDGNLDWGQDLLHLKRWLKQHPAARPLQLAYFGHVNPRHANIEFALPVRMPDLAAAAQWAAEDRRWSAEKAKIVERMAVLQQASHWRPPEPRWLVPEVTGAESGQNASFTVDGEQRISLDRPTAPDRDDYLVTLRTDLPRVTGLRLEVLPDPEQAFSTVGRAASGSFVLKEMEVEVCNAQGTKRSRAAWRRVLADWSQDGFAAEAAVDGDPRNGWSIFPFVTQPHVATFELAEPLAVDPGDRVVVRLVQQWGGQRVLSRFRLLLSDAPAPLDHWADWLLRPESEQFPGELVRRDSIVLTAPEELRQEFLNLMALGARRPARPADWSDVWLAPGWYAVSANFVAGYPGKGWTGDNALKMFERSQFEYFRELTPVATAGYSIYIYHVDAEEADRLRARYGLPRVPFRNGQKIPRDGSSSSAEF